MVDPIHRFADRVRDYDRHRPRYPAAVLSALRDLIDFDAGWVVADLGSGTGISTELFLEGGAEVFAVEPNAEMRDAAERRLRTRPGFHSVEGSAERTGLEDRSVDLVVAAQAFHWFDPVRSRDEATRILRAPGWAVLLWNTRHTDGTDFLRGYEELLLEHGTDYQEVRHDRERASSLERFFRNGFVRVVVPNEQLLDYEGLRGRLASTSYVPREGQPGHAPMLDALRSLFAAHEEDGVVAMTYDCEIFTGRLRNVT